jgi:FG-GAP-like repeat/Secretion system C-terminal sorting domain
MSRNSFTIFLMALFAIMALITTSYAYTTWYDDPIQVMGELHNGRDLEMVDIDSDGDDDVIYTTRSDEFGNVVLLVNIGDEEFVPVVLDGDFVGATDASVGDLDSDGDIDVIVSGTNRIKWYRNEGGNLFTGFIVNVNASESFAVKLADMNDDGEMDIVACSYNNGTIVYFANDGDESFTPSMITDQCDNVTDIDVIDIDEDGDYDLIAAANGIDELIWYENEGVLPFTAHVLGSDHNQIRGIDSGDFDGDGDLDIGVAVNGDDSYLLYDNDGNSNFTLIELDLNTPGAWDILMHDIDGDGDEDLFAWANYNHDIYWYEYDVNGLFMEHSIDNELIGNMGFAVGNIDGDDLPDLVGMAIGLMDQNEIFWWSASQVDGWTEHGVDNGARGSSDVQAADFDLDGDIDIVGANTTADKIVLYNNTGEQVYEELDLASLSGAYGLWVDDMDGDGFPDVLCAAGASNDIRLYTNNGDLTFTESIIDGNFDQARSVHAFDMDDDGDLDIIGSARAGNDVNWYENMGNSYAMHVVDAEFAGATDAIGVDLDQDGDADILACGQLMDELAWYANNGAQEFTKHVVDSGLDGIRSVVAADFDNDGDIDVAATIFAANTVTWWENDGDELFTSHILLTDFAGAYDIIATDLTGSDVPDLLISAEDDDSLAWLENDGAGNFSFHLIDGDYERPRGMCVADLNQDGRPDVISSANRESQIQWWENHFAEVPESISVNVTPLGNSQYVPETGRMIRFVTSIERFGPMDQFDAWISITHIPTFNSVTTHLFEEIQLDPGIYHYPIQQYIPAPAPGGNYALGVYVGIYPWVIHTYDGFPFHKAGGGPGGNDVPVFDSATMWPAKGMIDGEEGRPAISDAEGSIADASSPTSYALSSAYPNPFNPTTTIAMDLPEAAQLAVTVYNINGQQVAQLAEGQYVAGTHRFTFDASTLTSGLYFIHATVPGQFNEVRKVTLMK